MRKQFEQIQNGCPWMRYFKATNQMDFKPKCLALRGDTDDDCHYKNCAILYWLRNLMAPAPLK